MIFLTTSVYDPSGYIVIDANPSNLYEGYRRGSVTATLDGGVSQYDSGYSVSDQTLKVSLNNPTKTLLEKLRYLVSYYGQINISCETGIYSSVFSFALNNATLNLQFKIIRKLN
jgi:hypothetical protein